MGRLDGRRALVTGASSGIGAAAAELLAREGADVALLARGGDGAAGTGRRVEGTGRSGDGLAAVARRVEAQGGRAVVLRADVGDREALERAIADGVRQLGGLDIAIVAAAAGAFGEFREMPAEDFDRCVDVTFGGAVDTIRAVLGPLERSGGRLVVIGSAVDTVALPLMSPYVAAKQALDGFLESLRSELRADGSPVTLSVVRPGPVDTPFWRHLSNPRELTPPELPPLVSYTAGTVARVVVACAVDPCRRVTVGGATIAAQLLPRPVRGRVLALVGRLGRANADPDGAPNALWEPSGDGTVSGGLGGRASLVAALRARS